MSSQGSRLAQIQMRYQQKIMQETSQKKSDAYGYEDQTQKSLTSSLGAGKVRAMFDERRNKITAGIDKSYLLEPIPLDTTKINKQQRQVVGPSRSSRDQKNLNYTKVIVPPLQNRMINHDLNGNNHISTNDTMERTLKSGDTVLVNFKTINAPSKLATKYNNPTDKNAVISNSNKKSAAAAVSVPLKNVTNQKPSSSRSVKSGNSSSSSNSNRSVSNAKTVPLKAKIQSAKSSQQNSFDDENDDSPVPEGLIRCSICKRNFAEDRIEKHQVICQKTKTKKRKIYDSSKKRVQGTEAETYNKKPISRAAFRNTNTVTTTSNKSSNNWRTKHEDFIKTIRAAKEMQVYIAKGGKLSDLPPPEPSVNPDYVQCPHCSRRFNEGAANRHIPICQNINKPKAKTGPTSKTSGMVKRR